MGSKKKTTFAKLNREQKIRDRRVEKQMKKESRKLEGPSDESTIGEPVVMPEMPAGAADPDGLGHRRG